MTSQPAGDRVKNFSGACAEFACDMPRALQGEMADERSNASKDNPLCVRQQIVAPIQCRLEGPMPGNCRPNGLVSAIPAETPGGQPCS